MKVLILGGSGFVGRRLCATLRVQGIHVLTASLRDPQAAANAADDCDAIINLAGESIAQRWTPEVKHRIRESRTVLVHQFFAALTNCEKPPTKYISASAVGYYGNSLDQTFDENSPAGNNFLADVCVAWENTAQEALKLGMKLSIIRTGLVCSANGGALGRLLPLFRLGLGGPVGTGNQWYSWIHIDDVIGVYLHALHGVEGIVNATAPQPVRNSEFTKALGLALKRPAVLPVPAFALGLLLGEGGTVALDGQRVLPTRTTATGYVFHYETLAPALQAIVTSA